MTLSRVWLAARLALATALVLAVSAKLAAAQQTPGLSPALSAAPPYQCVKNYYINAATGNDSNPGTQALPWKSIANADNGWPNTPVAGECVNVLPGTYTLTGTWVMGHGGNLNSATGYVVYRSTVPQGAHVIPGPSMAGTGSDMISVWAPFIVIDGFQIDGNNASISGDGINGCANGGGNGNLSHHVTAINNVIHDVGGAGISSCTVDHILWEHNVVYNTSSTNGYQKSGLDIWQPKMTNEKTYTQTAADFTPFAIMIEYNIVHDAMEGPAITDGHTDGNGIIIDTTYNNTNCATCGAPYPGQILVMGNVSYNNGGGGIHVFLSENVTVANNTVYNNYLDPLNTGTARGELSADLSAKITFINNIAIAHPGSGVLANNSPANTFGTTSWPDSSTWTKNILYGASLSGDSASFVSATANMIGKNPMLQNPAAAGFVPLPGSPAIEAGQPETYLSSKTPDIGAY